MPNAQYFSDLPVSAATAYAQLHTATLAQELARDVSHLQGSYSQKTIKGASHWYFAYREVAGAVRQLYVGPDNAETGALIEQAKQLKPAAALKPLAKAALALGASTMTRQHLSVISRINEYQFFRAGGVLIGTHAFLAYANMLGIRWTMTDQTVDIDFAHAGKNISVALPADIHAQPHAAITTMAEGFLPMMQFRGVQAGKPGASYKHPVQSEYQIDFLCPKTSDDDAPITVPN